MIKDFLSLKQRVDKILPAKWYWSLAGLFNPLSAAIEGEKDKDHFYTLGTFEAGLLEKLGILKKGFRTLEIGCGPGRIQKSLLDLEKNLEVCGTDFSPSMVLKARKEVPDAKFTIGDGKSLKQYSDNFFDLVYSFVVFQHMDESIFDRYLNESRRVLKKNGFLVFQAQSAEGLEDYSRPIKHPWHLRRYTREEIISKLEKLDFQNIQIGDSKGNLSPETIDDAGFLVICSKR